MCYLGLITLRMVQYIANLPLPTTYYQVPTYYLLLNAYLFTYLVGVCMCMCTYLLTYLQNRQYVPTYLPTYQIDIMYIPITMHLPTYLLSYQVGCTYLPIIHLLLPLSNTYLLPIKLGTYQVIRQVLSYYVSIQVPNL